MADTENEKQMWLGYIGKLNERNISKRNSSGITLWVILVALAYLFYSILDRITIFSANHSLFELFVVSLGTFSNIIFCIIVIAVLFSFINSKESQEIRINSRLSKILSFDTSFITFSIFFLLIAANILAIISPYNINKWPNYVLSAYYIIQIIGVFSRSINARIKMKKHYSDAPELQGSLVTGLLNNKDYRNIFIGTIFVIVLVVNGIVIFSLVQLFQNSNLGLNLVVLKLSLEILAAITLLYYAFYNLIIRKRNEYLEGLEQKVILENSDANEIRHLFIKSYLGETARDFIDETENKIKEYSGIFEKVADECNNELDALTKIDSQYIHEIEKRRSDICHKLESVTNVYINYLDKSTSHIQYLRKNFVFDEKSDLLNHINNIWISHIRDLKNKHDSICNQCKLIHPGIGFNH
jgi:hypothetical protein